MKARKGKKRHRNQNLENDIGKLHISVLKTDVGRLHVAVGCGRGSMFEKRVAQRLYLRLRVLGGLPVPAVRSGQGTQSFHRAGVVWDEEFSFWPLGSDLAGAVLRVEVTPPPLHCLCCKLLYSRACASVVDPVSD
jgi:hypothetical protein